MDLTRRNFFKWGVLTGAMGSLPKAIQKRLPPPFQREALPQPATGEEQWCPATCLHCGSGLLVRVIEGRACGLRGDPEHPLSQGALCPQGAALLQILYHPDRVRQPLQRVGERGAGQWQPLSWEEALTQCARRLNPPSAPGGVGFFLGPTPSVVMRLLGTCWAQAAEGVHLYDLRSPEGAGLEDAAKAMMGAPYGLTFDLSNAALVLSLGMDWLQNLEPAVAVTRAYGALRRGQVGHRGRVIAVEPRLSVTAAKADEWIPLRPHTEGVLAWGLVHLLLRNELHDRAFVEQYTTGFETLLPQVEAYDPETVASLTGVPVATLESLAQELSSRRPSVVLGPRTGLSDQQAFLTLNALVGNLGQKGGVRVCRWPGEAALLSGLGASPEAPTADPPPAVLLCQANPLYLHPRWGQRLVQQADFIVSLTSFLDDSAQYADLILPVHTPLEARTDAQVWTLKGEPVLSVSDPAVAPLYDTRHAGDVLLEIAHRIGGPLIQSLPGETYEEALQVVVQPLFEGGRGRLLREVELEEEDWTMEESEPTFEDWFQKLGRAGGWGEEDDEAKPAPAQTFATASGRFEFPSDGIPTPPSGDAPVADFPLHLCVYEPNVFAQGRGAQLPYLQGLAGSRLGERRWETWVEINPKTAKQWGISDGEEVLVESPTGHLRARAIWFEGARPDTLNIPWGLGHTSYGRWASDLGANPAQLLVSEGAVPTPLWRWRPTRVRVRKERPV